jgi:putative sugar O-methyltransferase
LEGTISRFRQELHGQVQTAEQSAGYANYLVTREHVLEMLDRFGQPNTSSYWAEELEQFDYLFDAGPLVVRKLREHCDAVTGLRAYEYRGHHAHRRPAFAQKLEALRSRDPERLFVPESPALGGFGHDLDGQLVNIDTLKFYESLIALALAGELTRLRQLGRPPVVLEIGGGWGGFAYQLKQVLPYVRLIMVDLPPTFLFSGTYLTTVLEGATTRFVTTPDDVRRLGSDGLADVTFLPSAAFSHLPELQIDLAVNMVSFQEMTSDQVRGYVHGLADRGCPRVYSHNRDRSGHNTELTAVSMILAERYDLDEVEVLEVPYTSLKPPKVPRRVVRVRDAVQRLRSYRGSTTDRVLTRYRHLVARSP